MGCKFHPKAELELAKSINWYEKRSVKAKDAFLAELFTTIDAIILNPNRFQKMNNNFRFVPLNKFPFNIVYTLHEGNVFIISIFHNSRNPSIWTHRK